LTGKSSELTYYLHFDEVAQICLWRGPQRLGVWDLSQFSADLQQRLRGWMCDYALLLLGHGDEPDDGSAWLRLEDEGRDLASELKEELGPQATVFFFRSSPGHTSKSTFEPTVASGWIS
jgi:hypothetical protein